MAALEDRAKQHGLSRDEEAHNLLSQALAVDRPGNMADRLRARFEPLGGAELPIPARPVSRDPPFVFEYFDDLDEDGSSA